jgi:hypothetical protein
LTNKKLEYYKNNFTNFSILLPWKEFEDILTKTYSFEMVKKKGSGRVFVREDERFNADEPHGREPFVSKLDRKKAINALVRLGEF